MVGQTKRGKGTKIMAISDRNGLPIAGITGSAGPHEIRLVKETIEKRSVAPCPKILIGDRAYDSDIMDKDLNHLGIKMVSPHRSNRTRKPTQDGRELRRYKRRWKIERLWAWLYNFRRLVVRYEYKAENYLGMVKLAMSLILLRQL
jgi:transposase